MTLPNLSSRPPLAAAGMPTPRCCPSHPSWTVLGQHLVDDFSDLPLREVVQEITRARDAVAHIGFDDAEQLKLGELIARHRLRITRGEVPDTTRLDPERHTSRAAKAVSG